MDFSDDIKSHRSRRLELPVGTRIRVIRSKVPSFQDTVGKTGVIVPGSIVYYHVLMDDQQFFLFDTDEIEPLGDFQ